MIYLIAESSNAVKIGYTRELSAAGRLSSCQAGNHRPLTLLRTFSDDGPAAEKKIHARFKRSRIRGEWFRFSDDIKAFIAHAIDHPGETAVGCIDAIDAMPADARAMRTVSTRELRRRLKTLEACDDWTPVADVLSYGPVSRMITWGWLETDRREAGRGLHAVHVRRGKRGDERLKEIRQALA